METMKIEFMGYQMSASELATYTVTGNEMWDYVDYNLGYVLVTARLNNGTVYGCIMEDLVYDWYPRSHFIRMFADKLNVSPSAIVEFGAF